MNCLFSMHDMLFLFVSTCLSRHYLTRMRLTRGLGASCKRLHSYFLTKHLSANYAYFQKRVSVTLELIARMQAYCRSEYNQWETTIHVEWSRYCTLNDEFKVNGMKYHITLRSAKSFGWRVLSIEMFVDMGCVFGDDEEENVDLLFMQKMRMVKHESEETEEETVLRKRFQLEIFMYLPHYPSLSFEVLLDNEQTGLLRYNDRRAYQHGLWMALFEQHYLPRHAVPAMD